MWYLLTRYLTYFIQFISSIFIAVRLGVYYWGIWSFILLLINYFQIFNLGIENAANILLVQNKDDLQRFKNLILNSLLCVFIIVAVIAIIAFLYMIFDWQIGKYRIGFYFYYICIIGILTRINQFCMTVYRVRNKLWQIAFYQSIIPVLIFILMFCATGEQLLFIFLNLYLVGHLVSLCLFLKGKQIFWNGQINIIDLKLILDKGACLFIYNVCFYLIIVSTRSIVSLFYSVENFGYFAFSYTLANAILLLLESFSFIVFPKIIGKFSKGESAFLCATIDKVRVNYISMSHGLIYLAIAFFPFLLMLIPEYKTTLSALNLIALSILMYTNSFGYNSFLMAQGKERCLAKISVICLLLNVFIAFCLAYIVNIDYSMIIIATLFAYFLYSFFCAYYGRKLLGISTSIKSVLKDCMPINLLIPYVIAVVLSIMDINIICYFSFLPLIMYVIFNIYNLKLITTTMKRIIINPNIINI